MGIDGIDGLTPARPDPKRKAQKIVKRPVDSLTVDPKNVRRHSERNIAAIASSLKRFGQQKPIIVTADNRIVAGNGTHAAAVLLEWSTLDCVVTTLEPDAARAFAIADNRTAELAEWDAGDLVKELDSLKGLGFDPDDLGFNDRELLELLPGPEPGLCDADDVPDVPKKPITKPGDVWQLGDHRLVCGDCRKDDAWGDVKGINVVFTSPPYAEQREYDASSGFTRVAPDDYVAWWKPLQEIIHQRIAQDGSMFVNIKPACKGLDQMLYVFDLVIAHVRQWGWHFAEEFCWERTGIPRRVARRFKNQFEPVYQFSAGEWKFCPEDVMHESLGVPIPLGRGAGDTNAARRQGRVSAVEGNLVAPGMAYPGNRLPKFKSEAMGHSAAFPVGLPGFFIRAFTDAGDLVVDPFLGSGTTVIACEQLNRRCFGIEISPAYCDVVVARWEAFTGKKATRNKRG